MLITLLSWCLITFYAISIGIVLSVAFNRLFNIKITRIDTYIIVGMMGLTVYAGLFSVIYKVGLLANLILLASSCLILLSGTVRRKWGEVYGSLRASYLTNPLIPKCIILAILLIVALYVGSGIETFYDTELYHAQAIRWIEEYGIVKGLGILHSRFSYNSCFMPLQALFGFKWLFGIELHSVNAYLAFVLSAWAILTQSAWDKRGFLPADGLKCILLIFTWIFELSSLSSPNSDYFALSMAIYIVANLTEDISSLVSSSSDADNRSTLVTDFILYSFIAVYAVSLKLSVALVVLVALYPAYYLIMNKQWKQIACCIGIGLVIILPYFIRNYYISGYLVYPYTQIDIFDVNWKVTKSLADYDRREIMTWGKSLNDAELYNYTLRQWFPIWWSHVPHIYRRILEAAFILIAGACLKCALYIFSKKKTYAGNLLVYMYTVSAAMLAMWFLSAPLLRYGMVFALMIPGMFVGDMLSVLSTNAQQLKLNSVLRYIQNAVPAISAAVCLIAAVLFLRTQSINPVMPAQYQHIDNHSKQIDNVTIYYALEGTDWVGYHDFPAIPYEPDPACLGIVDSNDISKGFWNAEVYESKDSTTQKPYLDLE